MQPRSLVVAGNGMVGQRLVDLLLEAGTQPGRAWRIVVVGEERMPAYDRVHLTTLFSGAGTDELALVRPETLQDRDVEYRLDCSVTAIRPVEQEVTTDEGETIRYDALVIATGAAAIVPPVPGSTLEGCFTLRSLDDVAAIHERIRNAACGAAAVVGGGLLGIEAASALRSLGLEVHVVEAAGWLAPQQLDEAGAARLHEQVEELGIRVHCGTRVERIDGSPRGGVCGIALAGGAALDVGLTVFSVGVRPRDELARAAGLATGPRGGVVVDHHCRTSAPGIFAIGDVAHLEGAASGLLAPGYAMARVVAEQLLGREGAAFEPRPVPAVLKLMKPARLQAVRLGEVLPPSLDEADEIVCGCAAVSRSELRAAIASGADSVAKIGESTGAGQGCGGCIPTIESLMAQQLAPRGTTPRPRLCEHFDLTRRELRDLVKARHLTAWSQVLTELGSGRGCEVCKPVVAALLAETAGGHLLEGDRAALADVNDHVLANIQRNGTYSVVPRVPGGEITPEQLIALGEIARDFDLYCKITGGQRIDLLGAQLRDLPEIWRRVLEAGMESGHAYGKAMRTVKSCVGEKWCRFGMRDSVGMAVGLELRYRGLRSPHKIKSAVSGCARECAEARSKDIGVIATETGWSLYIGGNGGLRPRHADFFAGDLTDDELVALVDRILMLYVRTAERLMRTSAWVETFEGGLDRLRSIVVDDSLGICAELEAEMAAHVESYTCEWRAVLEDPALLAHFVEHVDAPDLSDLVPERGTTTLVAGEPVAIFLVPAADDGPPAVFAVDHVDPATSTPVLARGLLGSQDGRVYVASPLNRHRYDLATGECLDDPGLRIRRWPAAVAGNEVLVSTLPSS